MSQSYSNPYVAAAAPASERSAFIQRTYLHLAFSILGFAAVVWFLFQQPWAIALASKMTASRFGWLGVLGAWMVVSWIAESWANSATSKGTQYAGLLLFIVGEAIIMLPLLLAAAAAAPGGAVIKKAALFTGLLFFVLTAFAFISRKDFSFLRGFLAIGGLVALGIIVLSLVFNFGFGFGTIFAGAMVLFAGVAIVYNTSNIIHRYRTDQYVAAALGLFASIALMFWYLLRLFIARD